MPVKTPAVQEKTDFKFYMTVSQRDCLGETKAAYKKVMCYGDIISAFLYAIKALVDSGVSIEEAIKTFTHKIKVRPVKGGNTKRVPVKLYLTDADKQLLKELSALAGMTRQNFLHLICFGTIPESKRTPKGARVVRAHKVSARFDEDEIALATVVKDATGESGKPFSVYMREQFLERMADKFEAFEAN
jgi:hypothetical protein